MRDVVMHILQIDGETQYLAILALHGYSVSHETEPDVNVVDAMAEAFDDRRSPNGTRGRRSEIKVIRTKVLCITLLCLM